MSGGGRKDREQNRNNGAWRAYQDYVDGIMNEGREAARLYLAHITSNGTNQNLTANAGQVPPTANQPNDGQAPSLFVNNNHQTVGGQAPSLFVNNNQNVGGQAPSSVPSDSNLTAGEQVPSSVPSCNNQPSCGQGPSSVPSHNDQTSCGQAPSSVPSTGDQTSDDQTPSSVPTYVPPVTNHPVSIMMSDGTTRTYPSAAACPIPFDILPYTRGIRDPCNENRTTEEKIRFAIRATRTIQDELRRIRESRGIASAPPVIRDEVVSSAPVLCEEEEEEKVEDLCSKPKKSITGQKRRATDTSVRKKRKSGSTKVKKVKKVKRKK